MLEMPLSGYGAWSPSAGHYRKLHTPYHRILLRCIGVCRKDSNHVVSWEDALAKRKYKSLDTRKLTVSSAWCLVHMDHNRMPKRVTSR